MKTNEERISVYLSPLDKARVEDAALADGRTVSNWIRQLVTQRLDELEGK